MKATTCCHKGWLLQNKCLRQVASLWVVCRAGSDRTRVYLAYQSVIGFSKKIQKVSAAFVTECNKNCKPTRRFSQVRETLSAQIFSSFPTNSTLLFFSILLLAKMLSRSTLVALAAGYASAAVPADLVTDLPGFGAPLSKLYSGYLKAGTGKYLHYVYSESLRTPSTDPVVIWFNG